MVRSSQSPILVCTPSPLNSNSLGYCTVSKMVLSSETLAKGVFWSAW